MLAQYNESKKFMWKSIVAIIAVVASLAAFATGLSIAAGVMAVKTEE